jgi:Icc protein
MTNRTLPETSPNRHQHAGASPPAASVRLVQFSDTHLLDDPDGSIRGARTLPRLQACMAHARRHFYPVDAVLLTGDIVHDEPGAYGAVELLFADSAVPVLLIPGNHDVPAEMHRRFAHRPFQVGGEWSSGNDWQVLLLESWFAESTNGEGRLGTSQLQAVEEALSAGSEPHALVVLHHPPVPMDSPGLDELGLLDGLQLSAAVARQPRVRGVCWGHAHQALDLYREGEVRFMCTPATSMQFKPRSANFEVDDRPPGYRVIDLRADGSIASEVVWLEGYSDQAPLVGFVSSTFDGSSTTASINSMQGRRSGGRTRPNPGMPT